MCWRCRWEVLGIDQTPIAGGNVTGLVEGAGGEETFTLRHSAVATSANLRKVTIIINNSYTNGDRKTKTDCGWDGTANGPTTGVAWNLDGGSQFPLASKPYTLGSVTKHALQLALD